MTDSLTVAAIEPDHTFSPAETHAEHAERLLAFIDASPSPYHACETVAQGLATAGFVRIDEHDRFPQGGAHVMTRGGSLVAWRAPTEPAADLTFRVLGAHTDSPNLRVKPKPNTSSAGYRQLGVEIYGGVLLNSWLDRDLGLSGRVTVRTAEGIATRLLCVNRPLLRIPQLAIHLDREIYDKGLLLNRQRHLSPFWALEGAEDDERAFESFLAGELGVEVDAIVAWDVMTHPVEPSALVGRHGQFISAPRIDNLLSCYAAMAALAERAGQASEPPADRVEVLVLFDHEEVGSASDRGAAGAFLGSVLERITLALGLDRSAHLRAIASSLCVSADGAHATNPNYVDRHEPDHQIILNGGPVIKINANLRYATDARSSATLVEACAQAGVPLQQFVNRSDLACGSTIGPLTAAQLAMPTVDVGAPQLAMHSARELTGRDDPGWLAQALLAFLD